jgi:hypothetical protein
MSKEVALELNEETLNSILPKKIKEKSRRFFTPIELAVQSAKWLSGKDCRNVLDIGAGIGKFCLCGAYHTKSKFYGIEMRPHLVKIAETLFKTFGVKNAEMLVGNITDFNFSAFKAFYFYNPFHENIFTFLRMDDSIMLSAELYKLYLEHTKTQLALAESGSRLVTFHGNNCEVPPSYKLAEEFRGGDLKYWIKEN